MFHLSAYWNRWSRVLTDKHPGGPFVEVNIVPPRHCYEEGWDKVKKVWIRVHGTARRDRDISRTFLLRDVRELMVKALGRELTTFLLEADILSMIDFAKYEKNQNGGCALADCLKDGVSLQEETRRWQTRD
jgi:hypothetical protein